MLKVKGGNHVQLATLCISIGILITVVILPLISLFSKAFYNKEGVFAGFANFVEYFSTPYLVSSLFNTIYISVITSIIAVILAFIYAYAISRSSVPFKKILKFIGVMPLFAPTMMFGIGLIYLFGNQGLVTHMGLKLPLYGALGIIISEIFYVFPQVFLILSVSLSFADNRLYESADVMGATPLRKMLTITLPGIKFGIISALFVAFSMSFTDFGAPKVVGGNFGVLATDVFKQVVGQQNFTMGAVVSIILMFPAIMSFVVDRITRSDNEGSVNAKTTAFVIKPSRIRDVLLSAYCAVVVFCILLILGMVVFAAVIKIWPYDFSLTLQHFRITPSQGGIFSYFNSLLVASLSAIFGTAFVFMNAYLIEKLRGAVVLRNIGYLISILPLALPGLTLGIAYIFFFVNPANPLNFMFGTIAILVLVNMIHFYSVPFVTATSALKKLDKEFEVVSESMGVPFYKTFLRVTLPLSMPALTEIALYFFVNAMVTVSAVIFLYPSDFKLASIAIVNLEDTAETASAAALSTLLIITNILVRLLYEFANRKGKRTL